MKVFKGDAKTAFLQGSVGDQELHCEPIAELAQALGLEHQCVRFAKIGIRFNRRSESLVGTCGDRHEHDFLKTIDDVPLIEAPVMTDRDRERQGPGP